MIGVANQRRAWRPGGRRTAHPGVMQALLGYVSEARWLRHARTLWVEQL
jgi:hypothetical protein